MKKAGKQGKQLRKTEAEWEWFKKYRVWDADRKIFLYPENWIEPELRLPARFRESLGEVAAFICGKCGLGTKRERTRVPARRKGVCVLFTGKNRIGEFIAAQTVARDLGKDLYRVDLGAVVSIYIGETEKNLRRVFDAAKRSGAVLFFDEADALFGKRTEVHDSHDRYANVEINYFLQRIEEYAGLAILATGNRTKIDNAFSRRFDFLIRIPPRRKSRRKESSARPVMKKKVCGSCLCGGVRFEVDPPFIRANHCHCDRCRKHSGTAVCTQARVWTEQFRLVQGVELIKFYGRGEGSVKAFCVNCGSSLFGGDWPDGPQVVTTRLVGTSSDSTGAASCFQAKIRTSKALDAAVGHCQSHHRSVGSFPVRLPNKPAVKIIQRFCT